MQYNEERGAVPQKDSVVALFHEFLRGNAAEYVRMTETNGMALSSNLTKQGRRRLLREFVRELPQHLLYWEPSDLHHIAALTGLPLKQVQRSATIGRVERRFGAPKAYIGAKERAFMKEWVRDMKERNEYKEDMEKPIHLMKELNCSKQQFYDLWKWATQQPGRVTAETQAKLRQWLQENQKEIDALTPEDRDTLEKITGWSRRQLYKQLQRVKDGDTIPITEESKQVFLAWLRENDNKNPSKEERDYLQKLTGWNRQQLESQISYRRQSPSETIGNVERLAVTTWLFEHNYQRPNREQRDNLEKITGLARSQLNSLIMQEMLRQQAGKMTEKTKTLVEDWLRDHNYETPSDEEKQKLLDKTGWNKKQMSDFLRRTIRAHQHQQRVNDKDIP